MRKHDVYSHEPWLLVSKYGNCDTSVMAIVSRSDAGVVSPEGVLVRTRQRESSAMTFVPGVTITDFFPEGTDMKSVMRSS